MTPYYNNMASDTRPVAVLVQAFATRDASVTLEPDLPWVRYMDSLVSSGKFTSQHVGDVRRLYSAIKEKVGSLPLPLTQPASDGALQLVWQSKDRRFVAEVDVYADGSFDWFFRDRSTDAVDGTDEERDRSVSQTLIDRLVQLTS